MPRLFDEPLSEQLCKAVAVISPAFLHIRLLGQGGAADAIVWDLARQHPCLIMPREHVNPRTLFPSLPHGFSQIVVASGRKTAFISGQTAWDAQKRIIGGVSLLEQAKQALRNVQAAVEAAGGTLKDVVVLRIYIVNYQAETAEAVG